jgi:ethanolamine utilization protein EutP (predicted NTPase)
MTNTNKPAKLSRAQIRESLDTVPLDSLFSPAVSRELTAKQKRFARDVAMGKTKADAYRDNYNVTSKATMTSRPYALAADDRVKAEIEAMQRAIRAQEYQTPAALRALVIQSLVGVITDPESKPGQITAAAKVLGTVTEVAAFTERKEVRTITSSETARAQVMEQLRAIVQGNATDATIIDREAESLLAELATPEEIPPEPDADPHAPE